ncbi:MAG: indolepyruvate oxidoreductase subunit beta family protein [Rubrivivax sp.]
MSTSVQPITVLVCALGGEGGGVLAEWLYQIAVQAGHHAQATSVPGVAQRTGATTYYVEVWPEAGGRRPVFGLNPVPGEIDLLLSSELLETARQVGNGMTSAARTMVISSTTRALTVIEKMQMGDGRLDDAALLAALQRHARQTELLDLPALAQQAGTVISAVLLGAVAASGVLPFARGLYEDAIRAGGKGVEASLRGFALAYDALTARRAQQGALAQALAPALASAAPPDLRALARQRLAAYQDAAYVRLYDERLARFDRLDAAVAGELERWLALWMMFDDVVRVAGAKVSAARLERVRAEVGAAAGEPLAVYDHFKPGVPELAALLPEGLAARLQAWDRARVAAGREPWALPLKIGAHTVAGTLALRAMAALKGWRRRGSRFAREQALIERWLAAVEAGTRRDPALGLELARCGRLVKGYGSTHERGMANLLHIVQHLAGRDAATVRAAREAALADDAGTRLDDTLAAHGAPRRPPREQPVRWYRRRPAA